MPLRRLDAVDARHPDVHEDDVWSLIAHQPHRLLPAGAPLEVGDGFDKGAETDLDNHCSFNQRDADHARSLLEAERRRGIRRREILPQTGR